MEKIESLSLEDRPTGLSDLPVEILKTIIDRVVTMSGFYGALDLRRVNKVFDVIVLDSVLDTSRDDHLDLGYLDASDDLTFTALYRRVTSSVTWSTPIVNKIREIAAFIRESNPEIKLEKIYETLCRAVIHECFSLAIFNYRTGARHASINEKQAKLNKGLNELKLDDKSRGWFLGLLYAVTNNVESLAALLTDGNLDLDYRSPAFGSIPVMAIRFGNESTARYIYDRSTVCKSGKPERQNFVRHISCYGKIEIMESLLAEGETREQKIWSYMDCPRWATSSGHLDMVQLLLDQGREICEDIHENIEQVFLTCCTHGQLEIARYIVEEKGYQPKPGQISQGLRLRRPLCLATQSGNVEMVKWLFTIEKLSTMPEIRLSFKWAMRYAGLDMVEAYWSHAEKLGMGLWIDIDGRDYVGGYMVKAGRDAAVKGRSEHLRWVMQHGLVFTGGDEHIVVYKTATAGYVKCLKVLRDLLPGYDEIAPEEMARAWSGKNRRAVETLLEEGIEKPPGFREDWLKGWEYESRIVPTKNFWRERCGVWPKQWNYTTHY